VGQTPKLRHVWDAIAIIGADRCMFASNVPGDGLIAIYAQIFDEYLTIAVDMPAADRQRLFHDTVARVYRV
jgi:predicted TIM-barrel fold metal-dependent hydrolase